MSAPNGYTFGPFSIDLRQSRILEAGTPVRWWSRRRFELLKVLLEANGDVVQYYDLVEKVWGDKDVTFHTVNKTANDLKRCLGVFGDCVQNKHSAGFYFLPPPTAQSYRPDITDDLDLESCAEYGVALEEWNRRTQASLQRALGHFTCVLSRYPEFVPALLGAADCLLLLAHGGFPVLVAKQVLPEARRYIRSALAAAKSKSLKSAAHTALGKLQLMYEWDCRAAEENLKTAVSLDASHESAHHVLAQLYLITNRPNEALASIKTARQLSPSSAMIHSTSGWLRHFMGHHQDAVTICRRAVDLHPDFAAGYAILAVAYQGAGRMKEAADAFEASRDLHLSPNAISGLGYLHGLLGRTNRARSSLRQLAALAETGIVVSPYFFALVHTGLGDVAQAIKNLTDAVDEGFDWIIHMGVEPRWGPLHRHRQFKILLRRVGLEDFWTHPCPNSIPAEADHASRL